MAGNLCFFIFLAGNLCEPLLMPEGEKEAHACQWCGEKTTVHQFRFPFWMCDACNEQSKGEEKEGA